MLSPDRFCLPYARYGNTGLTVMHNRSWAIAVMRSRKKVASEKGHMRNDTMKGGEITMNAAEGYQECRMLFLEEKYKNHLHLDVYAGAKLTLAPT